MKAITYLKRIETLDARINTLVEEKQHLLEIATRTSISTDNERVKSAGSPRKLETCVVNIVDIGNYIMLLTGQPLHMYDLDKLTSASLVARDDYEGDFVALDEQTYKVLKGAAIYYPFSHSGLFRIQ